MNEASTPRRRDAIGRTAAVLACAALVSACSSDPTPDAAASATDSSATTFAIDTPASTAAAAEDIEPEGFDRVRATVTEADGTVCELCVWLAATADQRSRGLMAVTDLGPADAMAFRYPEPHSGSFWMKNTVLPLSIAFYSPAGVFLDAFDMEPCTADPCPTYATPEQFLVAVEVPQGGLESLSMIADSTLELLDLPCDDN